jgi:hypothetical protein
MSSANSRQFQRSANRLSIEIGIPALGTSLVCPDCGSPELAAGRFEQRLKEDLADQGVIGNRERSLVPRLIIQKLSRVVLCAISVTVPQHASIG